MATIDGDSAILVGTDLADFLIERDPPFPGQKLVGLQGDDTYLLQSLDSIVVADAGGGASRRRLVDAAKTVVGSRGEAPMTVPELTALLGVSMRTLEYAFRDVLGLSPVQYLRAARLLGVRRELLRVGPVIRVSDAAARWGFWHLSQFAADYKRLFGELPSERLRVFRSCPLITPERARSLLQMLAIARAMSAFCAWIGHLLVRCSDTLEKLSASETLGRVR